MATPNASQHFPRYLLPTTCIYHVTGKCRQRQTHRQTIYLTELGDTADFWAISRLSSLWTLSKKLEATGEGCTASTSIPSDRTCWFITHISQEETKTIMDWRGRGGRAYLHGEGGRELTHKCLRSTVPATSPGTNYKQTPMK